VAEYLGLIEGLEALIDLHATRQTVIICGDAKSIIEQMQGIASVSSSSIRPLYRRARKLARQFHNLQWSWSPRRYNQTADSLTRRALRQIRSNPNGYEEVFLQRGRPSTRLRSILDLRMYQAAA
jgi:ribonuclease HI